jgi:hypothetical protein
MWHAVLLYGGIALGVIAVLGAAAAVWFEAIHRDLERGNELNRRGTWR